MARKYQIPKNQSVMWCIMGNPEKNYPVIYPDSFRLTRREAIRHWELVQHGRPVDPNPGFDWKTQDDFVCVKVRVEAIG